MEWEDLTMEFIITIWSISWDKQDLTLYILLFLNNPLMLYNMYKIKISVLLLFLVSSKCYSQKISNGYYNNIENKTYLFVHNDTIILPFYSGMMYINIQNS